MDFFQETVFSNTRADMCLKEMWLYIWCSSMIYFLLSNTKYLNTEEGDKEGGTDESPSEVQPVWFVTRQA